MKKAVQQIMLGTVTGNESQARETLTRIKAAGYDGLEFNRFMIHPSSLMVRLMTRAAGMPTGKGGNLDWHALLRESGLEVVSLHADLGSLEREADTVIEEARSFGTDKIVITGMYRFDYGEESAVRELAQRLNRAGETLKTQGMALLYHNHNVELLQVKPGLRAYEILLGDTDKDYVNFEFDSYWFTDGGADAKAWMRKLGSRMRLWHVTDRGSRHDADSEGGQRGARHREHGSAGAPGHCRGKRRRDRGPREPQELDRQGPGEESGAERRVAQGELLR